MYLCAGCGRAAPGGVTHERCRRRTPLDALVSPYHYADPLMRSLIKEYKYHGAAEIGRILSGLAAVGARSLFTLLPAGAAIVAMPLHGSRERWRGFNQTAVLAQAVAAALGAKTSAPLVRARRTEEQAQLDIGEREKNCGRAFKCAKIVGEAVLVDDVVTSGATLRAAALAMKKAGASKVTGFALAHGRGDRLSC